MNMEIKSFGCDIEVKADSAQTGTFRGYASTFGNVDRDNDVMMRGAFTGVVAKGVKLLWQHNRTEPIGIWTKLVEDQKGLYAEGTLALKTRRGAEAYELMKLGALSDLSVGFRTLDADFAKASLDGEPRKVRRIKKVNLFEVSLVTIPANPEATVSSVKGHSSIGSTDGRIVSCKPILAKLLGMPEREVERKFRDEGLTRSQATMMVAEGLSGYVDDLEELVREATGLTRKQAAALFSGGMEALVAHLNDVVKNATGVACGDTQIIISTGYKNFVAQCGSSGEEPDLSSLPDFVAEDTTKAAPPVGAPGTQGDGVHPRDADAEVKTSGSPLSIEPEFFQGLMADLSNISGARAT